MRALNVDELGGDTLGDEGIANLTRHGLGGVPHGIEHHDGLLLRLIRGPLLVFGDDLVDMGAPNAAMAGGDHLELEALDRGKRATGLHAVRPHDVGVVLLGLLHDLAHIVLVVEALGGGEMLAERVVGEQDLIDVGVRDHVVGPMDHRGGHKAQGTLADAEGVARLHGRCLDTKVGAELVDAGTGGSVDLGVGGDFVDHGQGAGVIHLNMVGNDHIDLGGVDDLRDTLHKLIGKRRLARVDQGDLLVHDEVGVIGDAALGGVAVEQALVPIDAANPPNLRRDLNSVQHVGSSLPCNAMCSSKHHITGAMHHDAPAPHTQDARPDTRAGVHKGHRDPCGLTPAARCARCRPCRGAAPRAP